MQRVSRFVRNRVVKRRLPELAQGQRVGHVDAVGVSFADGLKQIINIMTIDGLFKIIEDFGGVGAKRLHESFLFIFGLDKGLSLFHGARSVGFVLDLGLHDLVEAFVGHDSGH